MIKKFIALSGMAALLAFTAMADNANDNANDKDKNSTGSSSETPRFEASVDYTFFHFNPGRNVFQTRNINGGGGAFTFNIGDWFGIKGDLQGYGSHTYNYTIPAGTTLPNGTVTTGTTKYNFTGNLFTYTFGPVIKKHTGMFQPFGEVLFGAAHSNAYRNLFHAGQANDLFVSKSPNNNGFAMVVGGGLDFRINPTLTVRPAECDYVLTRFGSNYQPAPSTGLPNISTQNQNSFRYLAGVDFTFGGR